VRTSLALVCAHKVTGLFSSVEIVVGLLLTCCNLVSSPFLSISPEVIVMHKPLCLFSWHALAGRTFLGRYL
jgi:hypothetical protein